MAEHLITSEGQTYRVSADGHDGADIDGIIEWLCQFHGEPTTLNALSRPQVLSRIGRSSIPSDFPEPGVVIGDEGRQSGGRTRGWLPQAVQLWEDVASAQLAAAAESERPADVDSSRGTESADVDDATSQGGRTDDDGENVNWELGQRQWSDTPASGDRMVVILSSRGALTPSGLAISRGPLSTAADLARFVWHRWPNKPESRGARGAAAHPQIWITAPALQAAGMTPPKKPIERSEDLSATIAALFDCEITSARAGWFTAAFRSPKGDGESRRVHLVLLPFLWLDPSPQRPKDEGLAGTRGTETELPDDEDQAVETLGRRIAWLTSISDGVLPAARPASIGAALLDSVRARARAQKRVEACPLPDTLHAETPRLDPNLEAWKNMPHNAKGDAVDVEVDQRAAYLASAGQVDLGYGVPVEMSKVDPEVFTERNPFGLWRITTPPAGMLDGLTQKLPLPHEHMHWTESSTFWATTLAVNHLMEPVSEGGAGLGLSELQFSQAWVWPQKSRLLRGWADILRSRLMEAIAEGRKDQEDLIKNIYKSFIGRMAGSQHPAGQRHYQQPAWAATIHADTRRRALRYAASIATEQGIYPIAARDIDTFVYRLPPEVDPYEVLEEKSTDNGKYRVKVINSGQG
ncbi:hypothetical protein Mycsm_07100 (plasmid) [Mycobacterium sp. JS623]|uniref:hypothetical protein n=1 Tax=Mycobacterium sp. JS623 TaxID=212767 RepID=UPI0002A572AF|nr:hypothetical protein [Mycobacterium sp. JS623]AGB27197.1 hypothetical protein Mycsm_07100 [Mycobacterium sp. JS623]